MDSREPMRIAIFETEEWERAACRRLRPAHELSCTAKPLTASDAAQYSDAEIVSTFIASDLSRDVLGRLPHLRLIATRSTGFDHVDLEYCAKAGVVVCNVPDYGDPTVAEHAFALLMAVSRRIVEAAERTRRGDFSVGGLRGFDLAGRTLGVVGAGRIGRRMAQFGRAFGMTVVASDTQPIAAEADRVGYRHVGLDELLRTADVVSLHVPGGPSTRDLISDTQFALMKPGAILINTSRGGVVDPAALVRALSDGHLGGAGLDVLADEALVREEAEIFRSGVVLEVDQLRSLLATETLRHQPKVVVTPHIAYNTCEAVHRIVDLTVKNIEAFAAGHPTNVVGQLAQNPTGE